jgi:hypothetical protein
MKGSRIAGRALGLAEKAGDVGAGAGKGILGSNLRWRADDHSRLVKSLAGSDQASDGRKFWSEARAERLMNATPEEVARLAPEKALRKQLIGDYHQARALEVHAMAKNGTLDQMEGVAGIAARAKYNLGRKFTNTYFKALNDQGIDQIKGIDEFFDKGKFGLLLAAMPTQLGREAQEVAYKYMVKAPGMDAKTAQKVLGDETFLAVDSLIEKSTTLMKAQADEGYLLDETIALWGEKGVGTGFHLPAVKRGTPGFDDLSLYSEGVTPGKFGSLLSRKQFDPAKILTGPTTKHRGALTTKKAVIEAIPELETDLRKLTVGGYMKDSLIFQVHRTFRDVLSAGMRKEGNATHWIKTRAEFDQMGNVAQKNFMDIDKLNDVAPGLAERIKKMLKIDLAKTGDEGLMGTHLPVIDKDLVEQFFGRGPGAMTSQANVISRAMQILTGVHKTARTALNLPTHMSNITGNMMFLAQAGMDPFTAVALNDGKTMTKVFSKLASEHHRTGKSVDEIMTFDKLKELLGKNRFIKDDMGDKVDLAELFSDDLMKDLVEAQSFETTEGFSSLLRELTAMEAANLDGFGEKSLQAVGRAIAGASQAPGIKPTLQKLSAAYLGEDMVPKYMLAMNLARQGWGKHAIVREVGRRLPQYRTVGALPKAARRVVLPWITFPAEAARITKNNLMDNPGSMMLWMQAPQIMQSLATGAGVGIDYSEYYDTIDAAQPWSVKYNTVFLDEESAPTTLGAIGGGGMGGTVGAAIGGARGAAIGAVGGALAGAAVGTLSPRTKELRETGQPELHSAARSWAMDFLPQSAAMLASFHPDQWEKANPFSSEVTGGMEKLQAIKDLSPVEPLAIVMPLLELYSGRGSFGRELEARSGMEGMGKAALGLLGFLSPPIMQKYGMKLEGPDGVVNMADIHGDNGGQMTLPKSSVATFTGLAAAGLTFLGASKMLGAKAGARVAAKAGGAVALAAAKKASRVTAGKLAVGAGAAVGLAGSEMNTQRLMVDLGILPDVRTGEKGDWTLDFFANSFFGLNKSWKVGAKNALYNEAIKRKRWEPMRKAATKDWMRAVKAGNQSSIMSALSEVHQTMDLEWGDTETANLKMNEWIGRHVKMINRLPMFASMSEEWIDTRLKALNSLGPEKSKIVRQQIVEMMSELRMRNLNKASKLKIVK